MIDNTHIEPEMPDKFLIPSICKFGYGDDFLAIDFNGLMVSKADENKDADCTVVLRAQNFKNFVDTLIGLGMEFQRNTGKNIGFDS